MCGRIFVKPSSGMSKLLVGLGLEGYELPTLNNLAPTEAIPVIAHDSKGKLEVMPMRWWLHPNWSKPPSQRYATFNARIETVLTGASFRHAIKHHRCIVPVSGFVEWKAEGNIKQPYFVESETEALAFAAIFDVWNFELFSCAVITQPADDRFKHIHDRMPLALNIDQANTWLDHSIPAPDVITELKGSCVNFSIRKASVSVNNAKNKSDVVLLD
jgi:putative SOS response-associated peptidase YedK